MQSLSSIDLPKFWDKGYTCGFPAFDELLGNMASVYGARPGSVLLLSAPPGTGKSRLSLTIGNAMVQENKNFKCGYFSAEQSVAAAAVMGKTMDLEFAEDFLATTQTSWNTIIKETIENKLNMIIIDSFPMIDFPIEEKGKLPDTKSKANTIKQFAETNGVFVLLINHANRQGQRSGRNELLHLVDIAYTLRKSSGNAAYDGMNVVEFIPEKNRDGSLVGRAFPFNGKWDLSCPLELASSDGDMGGTLNDGKVFEKKLARRNSILENIQNLGGTLYREQLDSDEFVIDGLAKSGLMAMLRDLVEEGMLKTKTQNTGSRGKRPIIEWSLTDKYHPTSSEEDTGDE
jgi:KaiC/GvpD/RAD55 family RecA-like ATPase